MTFEEKKIIYSNLDRTQKKKLKEVMKYFDSKLWSAEPSETMYGVKWSQSELHKLINKFKI